MPPCHPTLGHFKKFKLASKMATKKYISYEFGHYHVLQSAKCIIYAYSSPLNAIEGINVTLEHFVKIKMTSKMADSRFYDGNTIFFQICIIFCFLEGSYHHFSENGWYNVPFWTFENEISRIIYSLFRGRQNIFIIYITKFVVKCATKILKIGWQIKMLCPKIFLNREFSIEK